MGKAKRITIILRMASGKDAPAGRDTVNTTSGCFAAGPSKTESIYNIYAESFKDRASLDVILHETQEIANKAPEVNS
jgi:phosphoglucomutase